MIDTDRSQASNANLFYGIRNSISKAKSICLLGQSEKAINLYDSSRCIRTNGNVPRQLCINSTVSAEYGTIQIRIKRNALQSIARGGTYPFPDISMKSVQNVPLLFPRCGIYILTWRTAMQTGKKESRSVRRLKIFIE